VPEKTVNQGAGEMPGRRVDHNPRRLVHHDQPRVFIEDFEGNRLGVETKRFGGWKRDLDVVAGFQAVTGLREAVIDPDKAGLDQLLDSGPRQVLLLQNHKSIQTVGFVRLADGKTVPDVFFLLHLKTR
jgi:hypothetical protein